MAGKSSNHGCRSQPDPEFIAFKALWKSSPSGQPVAKLTWCDFIAACPSKSGFKSALSLKFRLLQSVGQCYAPRPSKNMMFQLPVSSADVATPALQPPVAPTDHVAAPDAHVDTAQHLVGHQLLALNWVTATKCMDMLMILEAEIRWPNGRFRRCLPCTGRLNPSKTKRFPFLLDRQEVLSCHLVPHVFQGAGGCGLRCEAGGK